MTPIRFLLVGLLALFCLPILAAPTAPTQSAPTQTAAVPPTTAPAFTTLKPFTAHYEVRLNNLPFKANAWQTLAALDDNRWRLELRVESFLLDTTEVAEFRWDGTRCRTIPENYGYVRKGIGKNRALQMRFDIAAKKATRDDGKTTSTFAIDDNTEDKLAHTLALACRIARGERGLLAVDVAWDRDVRHFDYQVADKEENVKTPAGIFSAFVMQRKRTDSDRVTTSWIAEATGWQAVQMQHSEGDGKMFQLQLLEMK